VYRGNEVIQGPNNDDILGQALVGPQHELLQGDGRGGLLHGDGKLRKTTSKRGGRLPPTYRADVSGAYKVETRSLLAPNNSELN
jgi:hypothetical protein